MGKRISLEVRRLGLTENETCFVDKENENLYMESKIYKKIYERRKFYMLIKKGTKAIVLGREENRLLEVPFDQETEIGDYVELSDGFEYTLKNIDNDEIEVVA